MKKLLFLVLFILSIRISYCQDKQIPTKIYQNKDFYTNITYLTEGESKEIKEQETAFRVIIITSEIYDQLLIEKVIIGDEGGNKRIVSKKTINLNKLWEVFNLKGEIGGLKFLKWVTWDSFEISIYDKKYLIKNIDETTVLVKSK